MSIRDRLKQREQKRDQAANGDLPEGVTRYVRLGGQNSELGTEGKTFVMLRDPNLWYFYYVHERSQFSPYEVFVKKHTCLHSPRKAPSTLEEADDLFKKYERPNGNACISDKAKARRNLYFMIPVYDPEYKTWRVIDTKEFHVMNILKDYDTIERSAHKFNKDYTLVGDAFTVVKGDKTYNIQSGDLPDEVLEAAKPFMEEDIDYEELANFRDEDDIIEILHEAHEDHVDKSVLPEPKPKAENAGDSGEAAPVEGGEISEEELPF